MKTLYSLTIFLCIIATGFAQNGINYKAQIKDANDILLQNQEIELRFFVNSSFGLEYIESHMATTDANGIAQVVIGEGTPILFTFQDINWERENLTLTVSLNLNDGTGSTNLGTTPFNVVPYALRLVNPIFEKDGDNAFKQNGNLGIGIDEPLTKLHVHDTSNAVIRASVSDSGFSSAFELFNGFTNANYTNFKIQNVSDIFKIAVDSDIIPQNGYQNLLQVNPGGDFEFNGTLKLNNSIRINEISIDPNLGESDTKLATQRAIKSYVDNEIATISTQTKRITISATAFSGENENLTVRNNFGTSANYTSSNTPIFAPLQLPIGAVITKISYVLNDGAASSNFNLEGSLQFFNHTTSQNFTTNFVTTSGSFVGSNTFVSTANSIVAPNISYSIRIRPTSFWQGSDLGVVAVEVEYTE